MSFDIESLGFTKEELQERVIDRIVDSVMTSHSYDPDSDRDFKIESQFGRDLQKRIAQQINDTINALAEKHVLPNVASYIENLTLQQTNAWGEKQGTPGTFVEYLTKRAEEYMQEKVSHEGKSKSEANGYSWSGTQTRITFLIEKHLHYSIESAMKDALKVATGEVAKGIHETARLKLNEIAAGMKVSVTTK